MSVNQPSNSDSDKKEFLYDVSSFANASGGHLIYGIKENAGVPIEICGLDIRDADAVILSLESSIRGGIAPRIPGLSMRAIPLLNNKVVIVITIPRSFSQPHMVTFKNASKFYSRNSAGKYQLDVNELRTAFTLSQNTIDRIRSFRQERLSMIVSQETPVPMDAGGKLVLHIIPIGAFEPASNFDLASLYNQSPAPLCGSGWNSRHNFDGYLTFWQLSLAYSYVQTFRNGIIEAVDAFMLAPRQDQHFIPGVEYEQKILEGISEYLSVHKKLGVQPPIFIMLSLLGVKGYEMGVNFGFGRSFGSPIDRDVLLVSEVMVEDLNFNLPQVMKPIFDAVWNAAGYSQSLNYDEAGNWKRR